VTRAGLDSFLGPYTGGRRRCPSLSGNRVRRSRAPDTTAVVYPSRRENQPSDSTRNNRRTPLCPNPIPSGPGSFGAPAFKFSRGRADNLPTDETRNGLVYPVDGRPILRRCAPSKGAEPFFGVCVRRVGAEGLRPFWVPVVGKMHHAKTGKASDAAPSGNR
jgi:hypothetical protein